MEHIFNENNISKLSESGFSQVEISELGIVALNKFKSLHDVDLLNIKRSELKSLYYDIIEKPTKYFNFVRWLSTGFNLFRNLNIPMSIYVGGKQQFIKRGDKVLEDALKKVSNLLKKYMQKGKIEPSDISFVIYYINRIVK